MKWQDALRAAVREAAPHIARALIAALLGAAATLGVLGVEPPGALPPLVLSGSKS